MVENGGLADLVADGLRGLTSNPSIFQQAIGGSVLYDEQILEVIRQDPDAMPAAVFERLAIRDIQNAADILRSVYDGSLRNPARVSR